MSCILNIETSTTTCSVALSENGACIFAEENQQGPNHIEILGTFLDEALSFADNHAIPVDAVAISYGPGSYTGLRIGISMAKGICFGRNIRLIAVPTLEVLCVPVLLEEDELDDNSLLVPMLDARRMEVYSEIFNRSLKSIKPISAEIINSESYREYLDRGPVYFFGNGASKCKGTINHPNARFIDNIKPLAKNMLPLAEKRMAIEQFEDVVYFVPLYLKDFVAKQPRKLL